MLKLLIIFAISLNLWAFPSTPDQTKTFGVLCDPASPEFTEWRYPEHIAYCKRDVTTSRKNKIYDSYGIPKAERKDYTIDHLIPLSIGGSNADANLWPEHLTLKKARGTLEHDVYLGLKNGTMTQKDAITKIFCSKFANCN